MRNPRVSVALVCVTLVTCACTAGTQSHGDRQKDGSKAQSLTQRGPRIETTRGDAGQAQRKQERGSPSSTEQGSFRIAFSAPPRLGQPLLLELPANAKKDRYVVLNASTKPGASKSPGGHVFADVYPVGNKQLARFVLPLGFAGLSGDAGPKTLRIRSLKDFIAKNENDALAIPDYMLPMFWMVEGASRRTIRRGKDKLLPVFQHEVAWDPKQRRNTFKVFDHVWGMQGHGGLLTKGPGGSFGHHRGLFIGWNHTRRGEESWDFWHCRGKARIAHRSFGSQPGEAIAGIAHARSVSHSEWIDEESGPVVKERRDVTIWHGGPGRRIIDYRFRLKAVGGAVSLSGDPQHGGFQFRAAQEVHKRRKETRYLRPERAKARGNDVWTDCDWAACLFSIKGHPYAVLHASSPHNPKPHVYSTRNYGRFGSFFKTTIQADKALELSYRIVIIDRKVHEVDRAFFDREWRDWIAPAPAATVRSEK